MRAGLKFGNATMQDTMLNDGLMDAFNKYHMGMTGTNIFHYFFFTIDLSVIYQ